MKTRGSMISRFRPRRHDDGASAVEFALVVPFLLLLVFGIISFGLYFAGALGLSNATREAARYGVVQNRTCTEIAESLQSTSSGTLGIVYPITFTGSRGTATCAGSIASDGNITYTSSSPSTTVMCANSTPAADELEVQAVAGANIFIPTMVIDLDLTGKGAYRCEFS
jgi:Flp pilus assembly protein TadG